MSIFSISIHEWQPTHLAQAFANGRNVLEPHAEKLAAPPGQFAAMMVSSAVFLLVDDFEARSDVEATIRLASKMFDIPEAALRAYGEVIYATAMTASVAMLKARPEADTKSRGH